jgi:hypothetical protein
VLGHPCLVDRAVCDQLVLDRVQEREVGPVAEGEMDVGLLGDLCRPWVDAHEIRAVGSVEAVEHAGPKDRLRLGDVVPDEEEGVAEVDVFVGARVAVRSERLLERHVGRRGAEARVAVEMVRADTDSRDEA